MSSAPPRIYSMKCYSYAPYPKKGSEVTEYDKRLQKLVYAVKDDRLFETKGGLVDPCVLVAEHVDAACPALASDRVLVPVPRSGVTKLPPDPKFWPSYRMALALHARGYGKAVVPALTRRTAVRKASYGKGLEGRDGVEEQIASFAVDLRMLRDAAVTIIDDVVTTGTQIVSAVLSLRRAGFRGDVNAGAWTVARNLQGSADSRALNAVSTITWVNGAKYADRS